MVFFKKSVLIKDKMRYNYIDVLINLKYIMKCIDLREISLVKTFSKIN